MRTPGLLTALAATAALVGGGVGAAVVATTGGSTKTVTTVVETKTGGGTTKPVAADSTSVLSPREVYDRAKGSVAYITSEITSSGDSFWGQQEQGEATGSGFVISDDGYVVTNAHVVDGASKVTVKVGDDKPRTAKVVGTDDSTDVALLKIDPGSDKLTPVTLGDSDAVNVGDPVYAIGNPFGLSRTLTTGVVSALQRQITSPNNWTISNVIQTDAALNPGNSGGPLFDATGKVVGINSQIETGTGSSSSGNVGIGFAVPINTVKTVITQLKASGKAEHAYIGVGTGDTDDDSGAKVSYVYDNSPADKAGIKVGDTIVSVDGTAVTGSADLGTVVDGHKVGDKVEIEVKRGGDTKKLTATLANRPEQTADQTTTDQGFPGFGSP